MPTVCRACDKLPLDVSPADSIAECFTKKSKKVQDAIFSHVLPKFRILVDSSKL